MSAERTLYLYLAFLPSSLLRLWLAESQLSQEGVLPEFITTVRDNPYRGLASADYQPVMGWIGEHRRLLTTTLLRVVDPPDDAIAELFDERDRPSYDSRRLMIRFAFSKVENGTRGPRRDVALTELAAASALFADLYISLAAANLPLGITIEPPFVEVRGGSVQYVTGGTMLSVGLGIVLACGAGVVAAPAGVLVGTVLASAGVVDTYLGWKKSIREVGKLEAEQRKLDAEAAKLQAERRKLNAERARIVDDLRKKHMEAERDTELLAYRESPSAALVDQKAVINAAGRHQVSAAYANHLLNRALLPSLEVGRYVSTMTCKTVEPKKQRRG